MQNPPYQWYTDSITNKKEIFMRKRKSLVLLLLAVCLLLSGCDIAWFSSTINELKGFPSSETATRSALMTTMETRRWRPVEKRSALRETRSRRSAMTATERPSGATTFPLLSQLRSTEKRSRAAATPASLCRMAWIRRWIFLRRSLRAMEETAWRTTRLLPAIWTSTKIILENQEL